MKKKLNEQKLDRLSELIRSVSSTLFPEGSDWHYVYHKDIRDRLYGEKPACFVCLKRQDGGPMGRCVKNYVLPMCNRMGHMDPRVIGTSIKVVQRLMKDKEGTEDINDLKKVLDRLQHNYNIYSKEVPKPPTTAAKKALATKMMNKIQGHLNRDY